MNVMEGEKIAMEMYRYKCTQCGFIHQVPAYWVSFSPDKAMQFPHIRFDNKETCENVDLELMEDEA